MHISQLRSWRNRRLIETDPWMAEDRSLSDEQKIELIAYRQELRDLPSTIEWVDLLCDGTTIVWPEFPEWMV